MKKLHNKLLAVILIVASMLLFNQFAKGQVNTQLCKDSYNRALSLYNKGQFARINNDLAVCVNSFSANRTYKTDRNGRIIIFKVYKLMISSYERTKQGSLALKKKYELIALYTNILTRQQVETELTNTRIEIIR